eukprot:TRINITY_DN26447_c0_g1_i1.p1 TRINITY_DN26447_c0_g1~~TRINITY_DN26447_c0_g1_i1.p1  ORF type:complete len:919 (+),score=148.08 TRINITY_DN26447_c0_g1_i1:55-2811(+)
MEEESGKNSKAADGEAEHEERLRAIEDATEQLQKCIEKNGKREEIKDLLRAAADPNRSFKYKLGPKEFEGNSLTLAVKNDRPDLVRLLVDYGALPDSAYSMKAGRLGVQWMGPAVAGTVAKGNIALMRLLVECKAMLNGRLVSFNGEPNVTLLYDASYFGHAHLVRYLIQKKGELDTRVKFQDDMDITFTPLHIASKQGRTEVVKVLLAAKARIDAACPACADQEHVYRMPLPVKDAIDGGHVDVVRMLVKSGADMFYSDPGGHDKRGMDYLFETNNAVMIAAAAKGLKDAEPKYVEPLTVEDFIKFVSTPQAEVIIDAIFRPVELRYWKQNQRFAYKTAYILNGVINSAVGPSVEHFDEVFQKTMTGAAGGLRKQASKMPNLTGVEPQEVLDERFYAQLLPFRTEKLEGKSQVPVEICQCILSGLHRSPEVLWVFAEGKNHYVFDELGSRAIVDLGWRESQRAHLRSLYMDVLGVVALAIIALMLRDESVGNNTDNEPLRWILVVILACTTSRSIMLETLEAFGFYLHGRLTWYIVQADTILDWSRNCLTLISCVGFATLEFEYPAEVDSEDGSRPFMLGYRLAFAIAGLLGWTHVLSDMKGFELTGKPILPILTAVGSAVPFSSVMITTLAGFVHAYYAMGLKDAREAFLVIYRLGFLADFERFEMAEPQDPILENPCTTPDVTHTRIGFADILLVVTSVVLTIVLMNILIGVLSEGYNRAYDTRERLFLLERSRIILHHFSMHLGWRRMFKCRRRAPSDDVDVIGTDDSESRDYVWFVKRKHMESSGFDDVLDAEDSMIMEGLKELRREMAQMHDELIQRQVAVEEQVVEKLQDMKRELRCGAPGNGRPSLFPQACSPHSIVPEPVDSTTPIHQFSGNEPFVMADVEGGQLQTAGSQMEFLVLPSSVPADRAVVG